MADYDAAMENKSPNAAYNPDEDVERNGNGRGEDRDDDRREDDGEQQERARGGDERRDRSRSRSPPRRRPPPAPPGKTEAPPSQVLGCFGLSIRTRDVDLEDEFSRYGEVEKAVVVYDQRSERSRGFGFVTMRTQEEAERCIEKLNGIELHGRNIRVAYSTTTKPHQSTPGQYMGFKDDRGDRGGYGGRDRYDDRRRDDRGGYGGGRDRYDRYDDRRRDDRYDDRRRDDRGGYRDDRRDDRYNDRRPERRDDYRDAPRRREDSPGRRRSPVYDR